jgi:hypothetical protein
MFSSAPYFINNSNSHAPWGALLPWLDVKMVAKQAMHLYQVQGLLSCFVLQYSAWQGDFSNNSLTGPLPSSWSKIYMVTVTTLPCVNQRA